MRDKRFIAVHRGGPLTMEQHQQLMKWAIACSEHVLFLFGEMTIPGKLQMGLFIAREWSKGNVTTGLARLTSVHCHNLAKTTNDSITSAIARSVGHCVATSHMADHCIVAAQYALDAIKLARKSVKDEIEWQNSQLPEEIKELILENRIKKNKKLIL